MINLKINPDIVNPLLGYKLDPGEPGIASSAPASLSIIRVLQQETGNLLAFKKEALQNGGYVVYSKISLDMQKRGAFLAAVAGKTQARIIYKDKNSNIKNKENLNNNIDNNDDKNKDQKIKKLEMLIDRLKSYLISEKDNEIKSELENKIKILETQLLLLKLGNAVSNQTDEILGMIFTAYF
jgi:flagellin-specific chaperone FliS